MSPEELEARRRALEEMGNSPVIDEDKAKQFQSGFGGHPSTSPSPTPQQDSQGQLDFFHSLKSKLMGEDEDKEEQP